MGSNGDYVHVGNPRSPNPDPSSSTRNKELPVPPPTSRDPQDGYATDMDYFSNARSYDRDHPETPGGAGISRKTSLYKKVKGLGAKVSTR